MYKNLKNIFAVWLMIGSCTPFPDFWNLFSFCLTHLAVYVMRALLWRSWHSERYSFIVWRNVPPAALSDWLKRGQWRQSALFCDCGRDEGKSRKHIKLQNSLGNVISLSLALFLSLTHTHRHTHTHTEMVRRFYTSKMIAYTFISQNTYMQKWTDDLDCAWWCQTKKINYIRSVNKHRITR